VFVKFDPCFSSKCHLHSEEFLNLLLVERKKKLFHKYFNICEILEMSVEKLCELSSKMLTLHTYPFIFRKKCKIIKKLLPNSIQGIGPAFLGHPSGSEVRKLVVGKCIEIFNTLSFYRNYILDSRKVILITER